MPSNSFMRVLPFLFVKKLECIIEGVLSVVIVKVLFNLLLNQPDCNYI